MQWSQIVLKEWNLKKLVSVKHWKVTGFWPDTHTHTHQHTPKPIHTHDIESSQEQHMKMKRKAKVHLWSCMYTDILLSVWWVYSFIAERFLLCKCWITITITNYSVYINNVINKPISISGNYASNNDFHWLRKQSTSTASFCQ